VEFINFCISVYFFLQTDIIKNKFFVIISALICLFILHKLFINIIKYGILDVFSQKNNSKKSDKLLSKKIRKAEEIKILFTTGSGFFGSYKTDLLAAIKNGAKIKILIGTKNSVFLNDINVIEDRVNKVVDINLEVDRVLGIVTEIRESNNNEKGSIELEHYSTEFRTSMILIKYKKEKWGKITLTLPPAKAADSLSFYIRGKIIIIEKIENIYKQCKKHFYKKRKENENKEQNNGSENNIVDNIYERCENHFDEIWTTHGVGRQRPVSK